MLPWLHLFRQNRRGKKKRRDHSEERKEEAGGGKAAFNVKYGIFDFKT